ncbi:ribosomal protein S18 acetylase RimI-like enzyme [Microcella alkaliphila]|uniref:Ribosomal protein S18 acetylase RimI-like enzyme n=1 Tax=Microcella alkaliphila TaxID=279828 RepID=A0A4Q7TPX6_9MICO|nr:ribosomal protein S18 acetylase RimI-like enzyme [Microcella alkaliphila]
MARILITGMSGAGKSTLLAELARRDVTTVDTDYGGYTIENRLWDVPKMDALLASHDNLVVSGTVENQGAFYDRFGAVVLLSAPVDVLLDRVAARTNNTYGRTAEDRNDIRRYTAEVEPLLRRGTTHEFDGRRPVAALADEVEALMGATPRPRIRPFGPADEDAVIALWHAAGLLRPWNDPRADIARKLTVQRGLFVVAEAGDGAIVGAVMAGFDGHRGWMNYLATARTVRGQGVGRALVAHVERELAALGCPKVNLQVRTDNEAAVGFYRHLGFAVDEVVSMGKRLISDEAPDGSG